MKVIAFTIALSFTTYFSIAQQISPSGIYGAANHSTVGNLSVNWVIGSLTPTSMSALPVRLISFKAHLTAVGNAELEWKTAQEVNNKGFEIQKSINGKQFEALGWVDGGNQEDEKTYRFTDIDLKTTSYYRLKQIDFDDTFTLSRIVTVVPENESIDRFIAFPNPSVDGKVVVQSPDGALSLSLFDHYGRLVLESGKPQAEQKIQLPKTGLYQLRIQTQVGTKTIKLMKN